MNKILKYLRRLSFPSIIYASFFSIAIVPVVFWEGLKTRYITGELVAFDISVKQIEFIVFSYLDKKIVDTIFTIVFWFVVAVVVIFMLWLLSSTYASISNILVIEAQYVNKPKHHLVIAVENIVKRVMTSVMSMIGVIVITKIAIPSVIVNIGKHLLGNNLGVTSYLYAVLWLVVLVICVELIWFIFILSTNYLKTSVD